MKTAADNMDFEKAAVIRDKINSLKHIAGKAKGFVNCNGGSGYNSFCKREDRLMCAGVLYKGRKAYRKGTFCI